MGNSNTKKLPQPLPLQQEPIDPNLITYIDSLFVGNHYQAQKAFTLIQDHLSPTLSLILSKIQSNLNSFKNYQHRLNQIKAIQSSAIQINTTSHNLQELFQHLRNQSTKLKKQNNRILKQLSPQLNSTLNQIWLGKNIIQDWIGMQQHKHLNMQIIQNNFTPDIQILNIAQEFRLLLSHIRSFMMIKKIFDGEMDIKFLENPFFRSSYEKSFDTFFPESACQFREDIVVILKNTKQVFKLFQQLHKKFLSKNVINLKNDQKQQFQKILSNINELIDNKFSIKRPHIEENKQPSSWIENPQMPPKQPPKQPPRPRVSLPQDIEKIAFLSDQNKKFIEEFKKKEATINQLQRKLQLQSEGPSNQSSRLRLLQLQLQSARKTYEKQLKEEENRHRQQLQSKAKITKRIFQTLKQDKDQFLNTLSYNRTRSSVSSHQSEKALKHKEVSFQELQAQLNQTFDQINSETKKFIKSNEENKKNLEQRIQSLKDSENKFKKLYESQKTERIQQSAKNQSEKAKYDNKAKDYQKQIHSLSEERQSLRKQSQILKASIENFKQKVYKDEITIANHQQNIKQFKRQIFDRNSEYIQKCLQIEKITFQLKKNQRCYTQYFSGNILNINTVECLTWFVQSLEQSTKKKIRATYPLYRFDKESNVSFHNYIDNKPQIVLILKMQTTGQIIAAYSEPPFKPKTTIDYKKGFMFGLKNKKIFTVKTEPTNRFNKLNPKPITYDDYYLMWGNSDIRIKSGTNELFSGYATANCCYEEKGNENSVVQDLFMQQERDAILLDYQLFQVQFEDGDNIW